MSHNITLQVDCPTKSFVKTGIMVQETPRIGDKVDLGNLFGAKPSRYNHITVQSVIHTFSLAGDRIEPKVVFNVSDLSMDVLEGIRTQWTEIKSDGLW